MSITRINPVYQRRPTVLFTGDSKGTIPLSQSAASFDYMRIYFRDNDGVLGSTTVYKPNGKRVFLMIEAITSGMLYGKHTDVTVSGTSIYVTPYDSAGPRTLQTWFYSGSVNYLQNENNIYITRVEAWN